MRKYYKITINQILVGFQYRFNTISSLVMYITSFWVSYFMWKSIYLASGKEIIGTYTQKEMLTYILIVSFMHYIYNFSKLMRLGNLVRTGKLTNILIKPISLIKESFFNYLGDKFIIMTVFLGLISIYKLLGNLENYILSVILVISVFIMCFYIVSVLSCLGFWLIEVWPITGFVNGIYFILSGALFPLNLLPEKIFNIIKYNPFSIIGYGITKTLQSSISANQILIYIFMSIVWSIIFRLFYTYLMKKGLKTYEGMGA